MSFNFLTLSKMFYNILTCLALAYSFYSVFGERCDLEDQECITLAVRRIYPHIISGNSSLGVDSSEPIIKDKIVANLPTINYTLSNCYMHGISNCEVKEARFRVADGQWYLYLLCPLLKLNMHYQIDGYVASERMLGEGESQITFDTYHITFGGSIDKKTHEDGQQYIQLTKFVLNRLDVTGKVSFKFNNLFYDDIERSKNMNNFVNDHWQEFNSQAQVPGMYGLMGVLIDHFNQYLNKVPLDEVLSKL